MVNDMEMTIDIANYNYVPYFTYDYMELSERELYKDQVKHFQLHGQLKSEVYLMATMLDYMIINGIAFTAIIINRKPWKRDGYTLIDLALNYCSSSPIHLYIDNGLLDNVLRLSM